MKLFTKDLRKIYSGRAVVDGVSIEVEQGEVVGLLGPNGAGKTTTFYMIVGVVKPNAGEVYLGEENITTLPMFLRARKGIAYLAQEPSVFRRLRVEENILVVWERFNFSKEEKEMKLVKLLDEFGLTKLRKVPAYTLSGGERRRVELARAIAVEPKFLLMDEPFTGIDPLAVADLQDMIKKLKERNIGIIITDHSVRETLAITDRAYIIRNGQILISGTSSEVASDPIAKKFYLGDRFKLDI